VNISRERLVRTSLETAQAHLSMIASRYRNGLVVKSDLLRAQVHVAELQQQLLDARSQVSISKAALSSSMGLDPESEVTPDAELNRSDPLSGDAASWTETALENRPDYLQIALLKRIGETEVRKAKSGHLPSVNLFGDYEVNSNTLDETKDNYTVGALLELPLFSGGNTMSKVRNAREMLRELQAVKREKELQIRVEAKKAYLQSQSAWKRIDVAEASILQAQQTVRILKNRYQNGLLPLVSLLDAELALQQSHTHHVQALHDFKIAVVELTLAAGTLNEHFKW
jgi:outer membrane protein TolC